LTKSKTKSGHEFPAEKQDFKMDLLDFPDEILLEILLNLDEETVHSTAALVCKRFLQLSRSSQMLNCVTVHRWFTANQLQGHLVMLRDNKHLKKLILKEMRGLQCLEILKVVAPHGNLRHLEFRNGVSCFRVEQFRRLGGILAPQYFGTVVFWHRGILAPWNFGTTVKRHLLKT
jgi:hypothetical protein